MTVAADIGTLRERVRDAIDAERNHIVEVAETIRVNPEFQYEEFMSSQLLADQLREAGFEVEKPYKGLETAFRAIRKGRGDGPTIAVLAEYDALRGIGHGCGHNLIAGSGLATAIGLGAVMDEIDGTFIVMGTPAEEGGAGKVRLAEQGALEGVDAALMIHMGGDRTEVPLAWPEGTCLATAGLVFEFFGKPSHSAADPENGINALNAVIETFNGINALRQHIRMDARIHGIITHGGEAVNVTPKYARCQFGVRAGNLAYVEYLRQRVTEIAQGAALMTGCELQTESRDPLEDMRPSYVLGRVFGEQMEAVGLEMAPRELARGMYSTDLGHVSYKIPSVTGMFAISHDPIPGHSQQVLDASGSDFGYDQFIKASTAMALVALDMFTNPDLVRDAWDEHREWVERHERG